MLKSAYDVELAPFDLLVFETFVPEDHYLRQLKTAIDFTPLRALVADCYSPDQGRGAIDPVYLLKLSLLQFHYDLSDEGVIRQAQVNVAFRFFLDWLAQTQLPEPSLLSQFRTWLEAYRFAKVFNEILRQARAAGLVKDRLRLKDATHLIANIAVPSTIRLVAQTREQLLAAAEAFAPTEVARHRQAALEIRQATTDLKDEARLLARVAQLRTLVSEEWLGKQIRKEHPAIERKLNELVRWHDGRRVRYRGRLRAKVQYLILAVVVNCKRIVVTMENTTCAS